MKQYFAFYCGEGRWDDRLIRAATRSQFSHVELIRPGQHMELALTLNPPSATCLSASGRDGGVREKNIVFNPDKWVIKEVLNWASPHAYQDAYSHIGAPYDWAGIVFNFVLPIRRQNKRAWFCSELCGWALGLGWTGTLSPGDLALRVEEMNRAYLDGGEQ